MLVVVCLPQLKRVHNASEVIFHTLLQSIEERLGMQHDSLMEKGIILDEVNTLTSHLREEAAAARPVGASLAAAANAYQERLRRVTRGMMATISELSLYQVSPRDQAVAEHWTASFAGLRNRRS